MKNLILVFSIFVLAIIICSSVIIFQEIKPSPATIATFETAASRVELLDQNQEHDKVFEISKIAISAYLKLLKNINDFSVKILGLWIFSVIFLACLFFCAGWSSCKIMRDTNNQK